MRPDVHELQGFYDSRQGQMTRRLINVQIRSIWPSLAGQRLLGFGFATPYLDGLAEEALRAVAVMPPAQGAGRWPRDGGAKVALARDEELPLEDGAVDRILAVHALETAPRLNKLMRELWRVLADGGRLLAVVPNRRGLWSFTDRTPFGQGQPYSVSQLERTMRGHLFLPQASRRALYLPPFRSTVLQRLAIPVERLGLRLAPHFAGVILIEAEKRIHVPTVELGRAAARAPRRYVAVPEAVTARRPSVPREAGERRGRAAA